jgi:hypothetical protein
MKAKWIQFQAILDTYKKMRFNIEAATNAKIVTNAWMKYYELYTHYDLIQSVNHEFIAFFNAELPGAALCAFNHFMRTMRSNMKFDWRASSIAPNDTAHGATILGDDY